MGYFYTKHFLQRLQERSISLAEIDKTLQFPSRRYIGERNEIVFEGGDIRVIAKEKNHHLIFLTAYKI